MLLARSVIRRILLAGMLIATAVLVYEVTVSEEPTRAEAAGTARYVATAYCKGQTTASGVPVRAGIAAADPRVLPLGSIIRVGGEAVDEKYHGVYSVLDTGPLIKGRRLDLYIWSCYEALDFGRRGVEVTVLRHGWNDKRSSD
jgi:3D (Asp-Asp-Asp) domain-containing protein